MTRSIDKLKAITLRKKGMSYSQIKIEMGVSKSTLSGWLSEMPLSKKRINELRANSEIRIEKYRMTMQKKKDYRRSIVFQKVSGDISCSRNPEFVAGFYLYWGEGTKSAEYTTSLTNTDPSIVKCFVMWLESMGIKKDLLKVKLHTYSDQNELKLKQFWSKHLGISIQNFNKSYIKTTSAEARTYKGMFNHGTCVVSYHNRDTYEYVMEGIRYLRNIYS